MSFLIDTDILSEVRKGDRGNPVVAAWWKDVAEECLWLSPLGPGKIRKSVEPARRRSPRRAEALEVWLTDAMPHFGNRVLSIDTDVAGQLCRTNPIRPAPVVDGLLAATAKANSLTLVNRNVAYVAGLEVDAEPAQSPKIVPKEDISSQESPWRRSDVIQGAVRHDQLKAREWLSQP